MRQCYPRIRGQGAHPRPGRASANSRDCRWGGARGCCTGAGVGGVRVTAARTAATSCSSVAGPSECANHVCGWGARPKVLHAAARRHAGTDWQAASEAGAALYVRQRRWCWTPRCRWGRVLRRSAGRQEEDRRAGTGRRWAWRFEFEFELAAAAWPPRCGRFWSGARAARASPPTSRTPSAAGSWSAA